jgi:hypothetical protein
MSHYKHRARRGRLRPLDIKDRRRRAVRNDRRKRALRLWEKKTVVSK